MDLNKQYICENLNLSSYSEIEEFPLYVQIETTAKCNSQCIMCPRSKTLPKRRVWSMGKELMDKIADELALYSSHIRRVIPQGYGEPLLDRNLYYFIKNLKTSGIREVFISTNASELNEERSYALLESGLDQIDFSIDAINETTYEKIRKGLKYKTVVENIKRFIKIRDKIDAKTKVRFRYVIQNGINDEEHEDFCKYWRKHIADSDIISSKKIHTFGGNIEMPEEDDYHLLKDKLSTLPCKGIFGSLTVFSDGSIPICSVDVNQNFIAGDATSTSLKDVWQGELFKKFRQNHLAYGRCAYKDCIKCNSWAPELKLENA